MGPICQRPLPHPIFSLISRALSPFHIFISVVAMALGIHGRSFSAGCMRGRSARSSSFTGRPRGGARRSGAGGGGRVRSLPAGRAGGARRPSCAGEELAGRVRAGRIPSAERSREGPCQVGVCGVGARWLERVEEMGGRRGGEGYGGRVEGRASKPLHVDGWRTPMLRPSAATSIHGGTGRAALST